MKRRIRPRNYSKPLFLTFRPRQGLPRTTLTARSKALGARRMARLGRPPAQAGTIQELARRHGIQPSYTNVAGERAHASPDALKAVLELFDVSAANPAAIRDALREQEQRHWRQPLEPVLVCWDNQQKTCELRVRANVEPDEVHCMVHLEDGGARSIDVSLENTGRMRTVEIDGTRYVTRSLRIPPLPFGYHQLELELRGRVQRTLLISAPVQSYSPPEAEKSWGVFLPMYAAHSERSWGGGNFSDWARLSRFTGALGGRFTGTLPVLSTFLERPFFSPSPYAPVSRIFWNEFYVDVERVPELETNQRAQKLIRSSAFQEQLQRFRRNRLVDYPAEMAVRRQVLEMLAKHFFKTTSGRRQGFQRFLLARPAASDYAEFRATCDQTGRSWGQWDQRLRYGKLQQDDFTEEGRNYHLYAQWKADEQIQRLLADCRKHNMQLFLDLPLGVHPDGYDTWRFRDAFASPASVGAPPDTFFPLGQNWGFAPPHPQRMRERGYSYLLEYLRFQMRHTGRLRIDHVMGLHRLFWVPRGFGASEGVYVSYNAEELHAILSLESHRNKTVLIGENLGTVPPEVNQAMERHRLRQMYVVQYEQHPDPRQPLPEPPEKAIASLNTHDMPTFRAYWEGADIEARLRLELIPESSATQERLSRKKLRAALLSYFSAHGQKLPVAHDSSRTEEVLRSALTACLEWLASSPAEMVLVNLEDLWLELSPQNVPGTSTQCPNWCRKAALSLDQIESSPEIRALLDKIERLRAERKSQDAQKKPA